MVHYTLLSSPHYNFLVASLHVVRTVRPFDGELPSCGQPCIARGRENCHKGDTYVCIFCHKGDTYICIFLTIFKTSSCRHLMLQDTHHVDFAIMANIVGGGVSITLLI